MVCLHFVSIFPFFLTFETRFVMLFYMPQTKITTQEYSYTVLYEPVKESGYQVTVPLLPGLITYGRTLEEARTMTHDAIICHLA